MSAVAEKRRSDSFMPHVVWTALGAASIPAMWWAWSLPGGAAMFALIGLAFVLWNRLGSRGSWMALVVIGAGMSGLLGWQAATGSRCPEPGTRVYLRAFKPSVDCTEIRTNAASMAVLFGLVALIGIGAPFYARLEKFDADAADSEAATSDPVT